MLCDSHYGGIFCNKKAKLVTCVFGRCRMFYSEDFFIQSCHWYLKKRQVRETLCVFSDFFKNYFSLAVANKPAGEIDLRFLFLFLIFHASR